MSSLERRWRRGREPWWRRPMLSILLWTDRLAVALAILAYFYVCGLQALLLLAAPWIRGHLLVLLAWPVFMVADFVLAVALVSWVRSSLARRLW